MHSFAKCASFVGSPMKTPPTNAAVVWRGVSLLDGKTPIVVVLTGLVDAHRSNRKTGAMVQSYILVDDASPKDAIHDGRDAAICGDCVHRGDGKGGERTCYVSLATGLNVVGRHLASYPMWSLSRAALAITGRQFRLGTYGDPAAVPDHVWTALLRRVAGWTGYTHQWRVRPTLARWCMASVDSGRERDAAKALGWRTFRVRQVSVTGPDPLGDREVVCPASAEAGHRVQCERCQLCKGTAIGAKDVAIIDHSNQGRAALRRLPMVAA